MYMHIFLSQIIRGIYMGINCDPFLKYLFYFCVIGYQLQHVLKMALFFILFHIIIFSAIKLQGTL